MEPHCPLVMYELLTKRQSDGEFYKAQKAGMSALESILESNASVQKPKDDCRRLPPYRLAFDLAHVHFLLQDWEKAYDSYRLLFDPQEDGRTPPCSTTTDPTTEAPAELLQTAAFHIAALCPASVAPFWLCTVIDGPKGVHANQLVSETNVRRAGAFLHRKRYFLLEDSY
jgi:hypothetical protein